MSSEDNISRSSADGPDEKKIPQDDALEIVEVDSEGGQKERYSKSSVWLMVLYSGLAIGSDG